MLQIKTKGIAVEMLKNPVNTFIHVAPLGTRLGHSSPYHARAQTLARRKVTGNPKTAGKTNEAKKSEVDGDLM